MRDVSRTMEPNETNHGRDNGQLKMHATDEEVDEEQPTVLPLGNNCDTLLSSFRLKSEAQDEQQQASQGLYEQSSKDAQQLERCFKLEQQNGEY